MKALAIDPETLQKAQTQKEILEAKAKEQKAHASKKAKERAQAGLISPIQAFNEATDIETYMLKLGYTPEGELYCSPNSESEKNAGVRVDESGKWVSFHDGDKKCGIGNQAESGNRYGDAFDLFCFYECDNDRDTAIKEAGEMFQSEYGMTLTKQNQVNYMQEKAANGFYGIEPEYSFDELMLKAARLSKSDRSETQNILTAANQLNAIEKQDLLDQISLSTGINKTTLKQTMQGSGQTDHLSLALEFINIKGSENLVADTNHFSEWDAAKGIWVKLEKPAIKQQLQSYLATRCKITKSMLDSVFDMVRNELYDQSLAWNEQQGDSVTFTNGDLVLNNQAWCWELRKHDRQKYCTIGLAGAYDPNATAPMFEQYLEQILNGDSDAQDKKQAILEMMGYTLMAHANHERFIMLYGNGSNGKSVLLKILTGICGKEHITAIQPNQINTPSQRAQLQDKLANIVTEIREGTVFDDGAIKSIVSGEPVTVSHKYEKEFLLHPFATCWFATNTLPHTRDLSDGTARRTLIIELNNKFEGKDNDPQLDHKILKEKSGILRMALDAYAGAVQNGFTMPQSSKNALNKWLRESNQVAQFLDSEDVEIVSDATTPSRELYQTFRGWAMSAGINRILTEKNFSERLEKEGYVKARNAKGIIYNGIKPTVQHDAF